jgi:predicted DNA repair protein MutK
MASTLFTLLDDLASLLDDVAVLSRVAAKKTAGVIGDDLALNANQVTGMHPDRELPVIWAVAKGALLNKAILVPAALAISAFIPWAITPLLMIGGLFLCYEGVEKLVHKRSGHEEEERVARVAAVAGAPTDMVAFEKTKIKGAIRTDFILSAEIVVIALGTMAAAPISQQVAALVAIGLGMTILVYGAVALLVKVDDLGLRMLGDAAGDATRPAAPRTGTQKFGAFLLRLAPVVMKTLSIGGTAAMFLVGGGIVAHGIPPLGHGIEGIGASVGGVPGTVLKVALEGLVGVLAGAIIVAIVKFAQAVLPGGEGDAPALSPERQRARGA